MKKRRWLYISLTVVVLILGCGYVALQVGTNYILGSLASPVDLDPVVPADNPPGASQTGQAGSSPEVKPGSTGPLTVTDGAPAEGTGKPPEEPAKPTDTPAAGGDGVKPPEAGGEAAKPPANPATEGQPEKPAAGGSGTTGATSTPEGQQAKPETPAKGYDPNISVEDAQKAQEEISLKEKLKVATLLLSKLDQSELSLFTKMAGDGLSVQDKREAKKVILQKLTEEEYNELIAIAARLGLSRGKTYEQSQKENLK